MDLSFWTQLAPKITYEPTRKRFFNRYLCRLVIECPGGRIVNDLTSDVAEALKSRTENSKFYNHGGSWFRRPDRFLDNASVSQLTMIRDLKRDYGDVAKFRVEEPWIQIYTETEQTLRVIAKRIADDNSKSLMLVSFPASDAQQTILNDDQIIIKANSKIKHRYKVIFKDGTYPIETKQQILDYLDNLGDSVSVSKGTRSMLTKQFNYIWGCFIYVDDPKLITFINLIQPNIISKIHELVREDQ